MKWFILYTKPQFEIKVAEALQKIGVRAYCPVYTQLKQYSDRKKKVTKPLLRSYVLVKIEDKDRDQVFEIPGVVRYVFWLGKPAIVREDEIVLMENNLSGIYESISVSTLEKGTAYTIPEGPFKGLSGEVVHLDHNKMQLELPSLGMLVTLKTA
ncbi:UpxY family transcription antiterminator [Flavobacteriaceae bacterium]|nr:UpxY family transcription antiterminator [Flavobacteriaceae bacterium]